MKEIIAAVKQHALDNYNNSYGWSVVVETFTDSELEQHLKQMKEYDQDESPITLEWAIQEMEGFAQLHTERFEEIESTIW